MMDSLVNAAARALAAGDPLGALNRVALRDDAPALALRGIAMAQLGELDHAKRLLRRAGRAFGQREAVARARCVVAEAEIALVSRDLGWPPQSLTAAGATLEAHGDRRNAAHARHIEARRLLLIGRVDEAEQALAGLAVEALPPTARAAHALVVAGVALRRLRVGEARRALGEARSAALVANLPAQIEEVEAAWRELDAPAARRLARGEARLLHLDEVEALLASDTFIVDACRNAIRAGGDTVALATRPVLFALARALAEAWPHDVARETLLRRAFGARFADESHRARLRVEIGRLRAALRPVADLRATRRGYALAPRFGRDLVVLAPTSDSEHAPILALLADGESWSSSALALALGASQRTVQRALEALAAQGEVSSYGRGRAVRWMVPALPGFPTLLLLPGAMVAD